LRFEVLGILSASGLKGCQYVAGVCSHCPFAQLLAVTVLLCVQTVLWKMVACNCQKNSSVAHIGLIDSSHCKQLCMQLADITQSIGSVVLPTGSTAHIWWEIG
jgi:hypothetical protein